MSARRKGKKNWRRNVDTTHIEKALDDLADEKRLGGIIADKQNKDLFYHDVSGDSRIKTSIKNKTLWIDDVTTPRSAFQVQTRKVKQSFQSLPNEKNKVSKIVKRKIEVMAKLKKQKGIGMGHNIVQKQKRKLQRQKEIEKSRGGADIWGNNEISENISSTVSIPAVKVAHPGSSYNPSQENHEEAIKLAAEVEYQKLDEKEKIEQQLAYPPELDDIDDEVFFDEDESDASDHDETRPEISKPVIVARKTTREKNKEKRQREQKLKEQQSQQEKKIIKQINKLSEISKQVEAATTKCDDKVVDNTLKPKRLGKYKFKEPLMEIKLKDELVDSIRKLKPEGNLFKDRFKSLEERNLLETRIPVKIRRKYRLKTTESHDYKRFK